MNKKKEISDDVSLYFFLKRLLDNPRNTEAFKRGIIDDKGNILRDIEKDEEQYFTALDRMVFDVRRMLGSKVYTLNKYLYLRYTPEMNVSRIISGQKTSQTDQVSRLRKKVKGNYKSFSSTYQRRKGK